MEEIFYYRNVVITEHSLVKVIDSGSEIEALRIATTLYSDSNMLIVKCDGNAEYYHTFHAVDSKKALISKVENDEYSILIIEKRKEKND